MQYIRTILRHWLGRGVLSASALAFSAGAHGDTIDAAGIDDLLATSNQTYAILCNTCTTAAQFANKALTTYPRASESKAFVYNLSTGQVRGIFLDWDREFGVQDGGNEIPVEAGLVTYVQQAGSMYRQNGNSLAFKLILRADGSIYWKPAGGGIVELRGPGLGRQLSGVSVARDRGQAGLSADAIPGANSPIDARGYQFPANFGNAYPNYPRSGYDLAFGYAGTVNDFVRDLVSGLPNGGVSGIFNGTVQTNTGASAPMGIIAGGVQISKQVQASIHIYIPMQDGSYARVEYNVQTGEVSVKEVTNSVGYPLPPANGTTPTQWLGGRELRFPPDTRGDRGLDTLQNWAARNRIHVGGVSMGNGGSVKCSTNGVNQVTCTIYPT